MGFTPTEARAEINTGPKITTKDDPGITMPRKQVSKQIKKTIPILENSIERMKLSISDATFKSLKREPIIYPKIHTPMAGAMDLTADAKFFARA